MRNEGVHVHQAVKRMPGVLRKCLNYSVYVDDPVYATKPIRKVRYKNSLGKSSAYRQSIL